MDINSLREQFGAARRNRQDLDTDLEDAYRLFTPGEYYGNGFAGSTKSNWESENLDATGAEALDDRVAEVTNLLFPVYDNFMEFEQQFGASAKDLEEAEKRFHKCLQDSNFYDEIALVIRSALISTGCLAVEKTMNPAMPINFRAISCWNMYPVENSAGKLDRVFIVNKLSKSEAKDRFGKYIDVEQLMKSDDKLELVEYYRMYADGTSDYICFQDGREGGVRADKDILVSLNGVRDRRLIVCRYGRSTGRAFGYGVVMRSLPIARQINYLTSLSNEDLDRSFSGWIVFDFDETPPEFFQEGSGVRMVHKPNDVNSPEFHQFKYPFNQNNFSLDQLKEMLERMIKGPDLPPTAAGIRSATEVDVRVNRRHSVIVPKTMTLFNELERPLVEVVLANLRSEEIADSPYFIASPPGMEFKPVNRFAGLEGKEKAAEIHHTLIGALQLDPNGEFFDLIDKDALFLSYLSQSGIPARLFRSPEDVEALRQQRAALLAEQQESQALPLSSANAGVAPAQQVGS